MEEEPKQTNKPPITPVRPLDSSQVIKSDEKKPVSLVESLNNWIIPIFSLIVLAVVVVLVLIPSANDTITTLDDIRNTEMEISKYEGKIDMLKSISVSDVNSSLQIASQVIKDDLEVAQLAADVESMAREHNLQTKSVSFSSSSSSILKVPGFVNIISGPFSYTGTFTDITKFISDLRGKSPTIVALREVTMSKVSTAGTEEESMWTANFMIDAFTTKKVETVAIADPVSSVIDEALMEELVERLNYANTLED